jgi:hypothetical protein
MRGSSAYGARDRTQQDKANDCYAFIFNARPDRLLAMTPERLCDDKGVSNRQARREVEARLLAAQDRERRRSA